MGIANNQFNHGYNAIGSVNNTQQAQNQLAFSQQAHAQYTAAMAQQQRNYNPYDWVWNGKPVSITEFAELAYGDTSQKSLFLLKYSDKEN
jgi:hypothetical protein